MTSRLSIVHLANFTGGWVTKHPSTELADNQSPDLDNILLNTNGFVKRFGDSVLNSTAMNSGADVQMLAYYKEAGGKEYMVAIAGAKMFKSDDIDGTMDEISATSGSITAAQNNLWTSMILKNILIMVGPDAPLSWDGSTASNNYQLLAGSPPTGKFGFVTKDRAFICNTTNNPSQVKWSVLANPEDWTGSGSGSQQVQTNDGDVLTAAVPLNNNITLLFKRNSVHQLMTNSAPFPLKPLFQCVGCVGQFAAVYAKGLIYFISQDLRAHVTDGYTITDLPDSIDDQWDKLNDSRKQFIQGIYDPANDLVHFVCSSSSATANDLDLIWDVRHKCWLRNTKGFDSNVLTIAREKILYGGHTNGKIYKKYDSVTNNDASETPTQFSGYITTKHINADNNMSVKQMSYVDVTFKIQTDATLKYQYGYDFGLQRSGSLSVVDPGGKWDQDTWDGTFVWGGTTQLQKRQFLRGRGNNFQIKFFNDVAGEPMELKAIDFAMKQQGIKEISQV